MKVNLLLTNLIMIASSNEPIWLMETTTYYKSLKVTSYLHIHGGVPCNVIEVKSSNCMRTRRTRIGHWWMKFIKNEKEANLLLWSLSNVKESYHRWKTKMQPLILEECTLLSNSKHNKRSSKTEFKIFLRKGLHKV